MRSSIDDLPDLLLAVAREVADLPAERRPSGRRRRRSRGIRAHARASSEALRRSRARGSATAGARPAACSRAGRGSALRGWRLRSGRRSSCSCAQPPWAWRRRRRSAPTSRTSRRPSLRRRRCGRTGRRSAAQRGSASARDRGGECAHQARVTAGRVRRSAPKCPRTSGATSRIAHCAGSGSGSVDAAEDERAERVAGVQRAVAAAADVRLAAPVDELVAGARREQHLARGRARAAPTTTRASASG